MYSLKELRPMNANPLLWGSVWFLGLQQSKVYTCILTFPRNRYVIGHSKASDHTNPAALPWRTMSHGTKTRKVHRQHPRTRCVARILSFPTEGDLFRDVSQPMHWRRSHRRKSVFLLVTERHRRPRAQRAKKKKDKTLSDREWNLKCKLKHGAWSGSTLPSDSPQIHKGGKKFWEKVWRHPDYRLAQRKRTEWH